MNLHFILIVLKQVNVVVVVIISMIHMQNYVFLMLVKSVPDVSKNMNVKVFNLISRTNETRYIKWHETFK